MLVSEAQAPSKLCPVLTRGADAVPCQGPACMAWRWTEAPKRRKTIDGKPLPGGEGTPVGFCGLAGFVQE